MQRICFSPSVQHLLHHSLSTSSSQLHLVPGPPICFSSSPSVFFPYCTSLCLPSPSQKKLGESPSLCRCPTTRFTGLRLPSPAYGLLLHGLQGRNCLLHSAFTAGCMPSCSYCHPHNRLFTSIGAGLVALEMSFRTVSYFYYFFLAVRRNSNPPIKDPVCCTASHTDQRQSPIPGLRGWKMCWKLHALFASDFVFPKEETTDFGHFCTDAERAGQFNEGPQNHPEIGHSCCLLRSYFHFYLQSFRCGLVPRAITSRGLSRSQGSGGGCWGLRAPPARRPTRAAPGPAAARAAQQILPTSHTGQDSCFSSG